MGKSPSDGYDSWGDGLKYSRLLYCTFTEFVKHYPGTRKNTYKSQRSYYQKLIREGKKQMPPSPEQMPEKKLIKSWEVAMRGQDGEWDTTTLHSYEHPDPDGLSETFAPATPAKITPSKRKPEKRDHKVLFVFSDAQVDYRRMDDGELVPIHDERAMRVASMICKDVMPDEIINLGDTVDLAALSRFKADSNHFQRTLGPSFQRVHDFYAQLIADSPWAKVTEVDSNHNTRLKDFFIKNTPDLYGYRRPNDQDEFPMFTYPYMANLGHLGVQWISGYGAAEYVYGAEYDKPPIIFKHGKTVVSGGSTAAKESKDNPYNNVVRGHSHRADSYYRTTRHGDYLGSFVVGALCRTTGEVPSYHSAVDDNGEVVKYQEDWQQAVMVIRDYEGTYDFQHILIKDGQAWFNGKLYDGRDIIEPRGQTK